MQQAVVKTDVPPSSFPESFLNGLIAGTPLAIDLEGFQ
jgi:hypothetical protein